LRHQVLERVSKCKIIDSIIVQTNLYNAVIIEQSILKENKNCAHLPLQNYPGYTECFNIGYKELIVSELNKKLHNE